MVTRSNDYLMRKVNSSGRKYWLKVVSKAGAASSLKLKLKELIGFQEKTFKTDGDEMTIEQTGGLKIQILNCLRFII